MKKMKKKKKLSKREKEILLFLYKYRVSEIKTIQTAMRYKNYDNARKLLKRMYDHNYLIRYRLNIYEPYQYALSYKGFLKMGNSSAQTYDFLSQEKYNHLLHSKLVSWIMRDNENLEIKDFISQREKIRSEERRVGKECRNRMWRIEYKKSIERIEEYRREKRVKN